MEAKEESEMEDDRLWRDAQGRVMWQVKNYSYTVLVV